MTCSPRFHQRRLISDWRTFPGSHIGSSSKLKLDANSPCWQQVGQGHLSGKATIQPSALRLFVDEGAGENALVDDPEEITATDEGASDGREAHDMCRSLSSSYQSSEFRA